MRRWVATDSWTMPESASAECLILATGIQPPGWRWDPVAGLASATDPLPTSGPGTLLTVADALDTESPPPVDPPTGSDAPDPHDLRMASTRFAQVLAEALDGQRRLTQLESWFDRDSLKVLAGRQVKLQGTRVRLASVRFQPMSPCSAEVAMRLTTPNIDYAAALRITRRGDKWSCTDLVMG